MRNLGPLLLGGLLLTYVGHPERAAAGEPRVVVGDDLRELSLPLKGPLLEALRARRWADAVNLLRAFPADTLVGSQRGDHAFLLCWSLVHAGRAEEALPLEPLMATAQSAPPSYVELLRGELARARGEGLVALEHLGRVGEHAVVWPRAMVQRAEVLRELGRTEESYELYEALIARPDPASGTPEALMVLARRAGIPSPPAYEHLRRLWSKYGGHELAPEAAQLLSRWPDDPRWKSNADQGSWRALRLMEAGNWTSAIAEADRWLPSATSAEAACRLRFAKGRALYKLNKLGESVAAFGDLGKPCAEIEGDYGAPGLYLAGTAEFRKGNYRSSVAQYDRLVAYYPRHSMADDALTRGGISLQEAGDLAGARERWRKALADYPEGDTVPEATWRLAFSYYLEGNAEEARSIAEALGRLPLQGDAVHVAAGRYWAARWALYPDVESPQEAVPEPRAREEAIAGWRALCLELPHSFYSILAWSRLKEEAPDVAAELAERGLRGPPATAETPWVVRLSFFENPALQDGVALARIGLLTEARAEWRALPEDTLLGDEKAWLTELRIANGDWLFAHDDFRSWLKSHPPGTLGPREGSVIRVAWPDRYWDIVQEVTTGYRYEPRLFHALVREESNFNRTIVSFAGARGLSQLMPATAKQTAGWLGMSISMDDLDDPKTNLRIGSRYFEAMHKQLSNSPYLSLAAYNAGAGRVDQWLGAWGNVPTDEYVERIPFRETREYVKRVMGSWQTMRWEFDDGPAFYDLSGFNHRARP